MFEKTIGIDMGTRVLKLYKSGEGVIFDQEAVVAIEKKKKLLAIGDEAADMAEKSPVGIDVIYPMQNGVIAHVTAMLKLLNECFRQCFGHPRKARGMNYLVAIPTDITEVQKRAFVEILLDSDARPKKVNLVDKPICAALGAGLDVTNASGIMVVDIGAATTEVSILSLGGIVLSRLINVGGNHIDDSIRLAVKKAYNLYIGDKTAENIKKELAFATPSEIITKKVYGRDVVTGLPKEVEISSDMVYQAIKEQLHTIVDAIRIILERTPPEISSDIIDSGIYVTGGCANIGHLADLFHEETDLTINIVDDPENSVVKGLGVIMEDSSLETLAYSYRQTNYAIRTRG